MIASVLIVLVFYIFRRANPACSDHLTSAACTVENCTWTQTAPASCSVPAGADCPMSKCSAGSAGCVHIPQTGTCEDTVAVDCASKPQGGCTGNCAWNSAPITGTCVNPQLLCKFNQDGDCADANGATTGCTPSQSYLGCSHQFFYANAECAKQPVDYGRCIEYGCKQVGQACVAQTFSEYCQALTSAPSECEFFTLGDCKVEQDHCVPTGDAEDCGEYSIDPVDCESFSSGWCEMQNSVCVLNSSRTPYACKDNAGGTACDDGSLESDQCTELDEHFCERTSDQCATNAGKTACDTYSADVQLCAFVPSPPFCGMTGTPKTCGTPTSGGTCAVAGCSFVEVQAADCVPDSSVTCTTCSAAEVLSGCVSTEEVGTCAGSSAVAVRVPFYFFIVAALFSHLFFF